MVKYYANIYYMNAVDKEKIYDLLKTISTSIHGYIPSNFSGPKPQFQDKNNESASEIKNDNLQNIEERTPSNTRSLTKDYTESLNKATQNEIFQKNISTSSVAHKIANCTRCALSNSRTNTVVGTGVSNPLVLVIGDVPNSEEDISGIPFSGKEGQLLDKMLSAISLSKHNNCYIANIIKCKTPQNREPYREEISACYSFIEAQINILKPKMILLLGNNASQTIFRTNLDINSIHGKIENFCGIATMATFHPKTLIQNQALKINAWQDLKTFKSKLLEIEPNYQMTFNKD